LPFNVRRIVVAVDTAKPDTYQFFDNCGNIQTMNCIHCGQPITPGARFCVACGREQVAASPQSQQPYAGPSSVTPATKSAGCSGKAIFIMAAALLLILAIGGVIAFFYFFPPGVLVKDNFKKPHPQLESKIRTLGKAARFFNDALEIDPPNKRFYTLIYDTASPERATVEGTVEWKEGDKDTMFGIICCAIDENDFYVLMINGRGEYLLQSYEDSNWVDLTGYMKLPKLKAIKKDVPYKMKIVSEGDYISAFLDDQLLAKVMDPVIHKGKPGIYAQGGQDGKSTIAFHELRAKKNSMFQSD
jgi:zinc-ribbon domain